MQRINTTFLLGSIIVISVATFGLQFYWNTLNYDAHKKRLDEEVKTTFEYAINSYFEEQSKKDIIGFFSESEQLSTDDFISAIRLDTVLLEKKKSKKIKPKNHTRKIDSLVIESLSPETFKSIEIFPVNPSKLHKDTSISNNLVIEIHKPKINVIKGKKAIDDIGDIRRFKNRMVITMNRDTLNFVGLENILDTTLKKENLALDFQIYHKKNDTIHFESQQEKKDLSQNFISKSAFINKNETLGIKYELPKQLIIKNISLEILLSFLLSSVIVLILIYLLQTIKKLKKIDAYKNDFISNMTHELKTPITTVKAALEGISNFNTNKDPLITEKYLNISNEHLNKLNTLVEKILETATLKTNNIKTTQEVILVDSFLSKIIEKFRNITTKTIALEVTDHPTKIISDPFHLEQMISNLIDNAIKYGGYNIWLKLSYQGKNIIIQCIDNGNGIDKDEQKKIFDQFYRVPKGNKHDIKGFGIGLYYARTMAHNLGGTLVYQAFPNPTFVLTLPYEPTY
jgi:signal transduction histidine kinase